MTDGLQKAAGERTSADTRALMLFEANRKSLAVSYLLWLFVGVLGGHRFYNGRIATAVTQLLMWALGFMLVSAFGLGFLLLIPLGLWLLTDAFLIPGWVNAHNTALAEQLGA